MYHFSANGIATGDGTGWIDVHSSADGQNWVKVDSGIPCFPGVGMAVAIDAANVIHLVSYDGSGHPAYQKFNSADSLKGDHTWEGIERIDESGIANKGRCALAIDVNGIPHLLYQVDGKYQGKHTTALAYTNRIGGAWNVTVLFSKIDDSGFSSPLGIAVGPDNLPYIHLGKKILRGNANNPDTFETKELGEAHSFAIHQNGDVRVALASKGMYANQLHDHSQPWDKGWSLMESSTPDKGGVLVLAEDKPWLVTLEPDGLRVKREFEPSRLAVTQPAGRAWKDLTARWSFYNHHSPWMIDMAASSWDAALGNGYWYGHYVTRTVADFSVVPATGAAPLSVLFSNNSQPADGQIITLNEWDFENRGKVDSTEANPAHLYGKPGSYLARLTVTDSAGATDTRVMKNLIVADGDAYLHPLAAVATLSISTSSLPAGTVGSAYSQALAATGGATPYTWSKTSGSLPAGLTLSNAGVISGTPTTAGNSSFTVQVKDKNKATAKKTLSITINTMPLAITTTLLADGYLTTTYKQTLTATGGKAPYVWSRTSGSLPAGLSMSTTGIISGTPTSAGTSTFTVQVKDASTITATKALNISIALPLSVTTTTLPNGSVGSVYGQTLAAIGGKTPYTWSITTGILPAGVILNTSTGLISGTPTVAGTTSFTVQAKDANNTISTMDLGLTVNYPVNITTTAVHDGYAGINYSHLLAATDGVPPYTWSISGGSLPAGLALDASTGMIGGTPTTAGASNFTVQIIDAGNAAAIRAYTVNISNFGSIRGLVTEQTTGAPIPGATVTLNLSDIKNRNTSDFIYRCEGMPISANDYSKISTNDDVKLGCDGSYDTIAKMRNPFGVADPFTIRWNGLSAYGGGEYLAQSFKPTKSGGLNRVSFYFSGYSMTYGTSTGSVYVLLKSALGGDIGSYLANSAIMNVTPQTLTGWVDFDFTSPVSVVAGQEYFVELQGRFPVWPLSSETYYDTATWGNGIQYSDGRSYQRSGGIWGQLDNSLAFRTYVDDNPDITSTVPTQGIDMHGAVSYTPKIYLSNISSGQLESCSIDYGYNPNFSVASNSSDYNCTKTTTSGNNYYDQNGWITVIMYSQSSYSSLSEMYSTLLVTDHFSLTFNRTLSTVTDANGAYSFANLPDGNYSVSINNPVYLTQSTGGSLTPGQTVDMGTISLAKAPPASLQGQIQLSGGSTSYGAGVTVTLTDPVGTHTTISDANGNYRIDGIAYGAYSITFSDPYLQSLTDTGTLAAGQTATQNVWMYVKRPVATLSAPLAGATITTLIRPPSVNR